SGEEAHANEWPYVTGCPALGGHAVYGRARLGAVYRQYSGHGRRPERGRGGAGQSGPPQHRDAGSCYEHDRRLWELSFPEPCLAPGSYKITVEAKGFSKSETSFTLETNQNLN